MTPEQFKNYRQELDMDIPAIAAFLRVGPRNIRRWEAAAQDIPLWVERFLPMIVAVMTGPRYFLLKAMIEEQEETVS
jgi:hypothetical protein